MLRLVFERRRTAWLEKLPFAALAGFCGLAIAFWLFWNQSRTPIEVKTERYGLPPIELCYESIAAPSSPLGCAEQHSQAYSLLAKELSLVAINGRPDKTVDSQRARVRLRHSKSEVEIPHKGDIFLDQESGTGFFIFSAKKTNNRILFDFVNERQLEVQVFRNDEESEALTEQFPLFKAPRTIKKPPEALAEAPYFKVVMDAVFWGEDLLHGRLMSSKKQTAFLLETIALPNQAATPLLIEEGTLLVWENNRWQVVLDPMSAIDRPLAKIERVFHDALKITIWDPTGLIEYTFSLPQRKLDHWLIPSIKIQDPRLCWPSQPTLSCSIGGKRFLLRPGDWLVKTSQGYWKKVPAEEQRALFQKATQGPLFIVESFDLESLHGELFHEKRTKSQTITLPLTQIQATTPRPPSPHRETKKKSKPPLSTTH